MRKVIVRVFIIITIMIFSNVALAFPNEPNGFQDYKWGMSIKDCLNVAQKNKDIFKLYFNNEIINKCRMSNIKRYKVQFSGVRLKYLKNISYQTSFIFVDDKLESIFISFNTKNIHDGREFKKFINQMKENLQVHYGHPTEFKDEKNIKSGNWLKEYTWNGENVLIIFKGLSWGSNNRNMSIFMEYKSLIPRRPVEI